MLATSPRRWAVSNTDFQRQARSIRDARFLIVEDRKEGFSSSSVRTRSFSTSLPPTFFMPCRKFSVKSRGRSHTPQMVRISA
jgi:hypothetical protein